jgi:MFS family permease
LWGVSLVEGYSLVLRVGALLVLLAGAPLTFVSEKFEVSGERFELRRLFKGVPRKLLPVIVVNILMGFGAAISIHNIDYYFAAKYGVTSGGLGTLFGTQQLLMGLLMLRLPQAADRAGGELRLYLILTSFSIPLLVGITLVNDYVIASAMFLIRSILINMVNPLFNSFVFKLVPAERRGIIGGIMGLTWTVPAGFGRAIGGRLLDYNLELPLRITALMYTLAMLYLALSYREYTIGKGRVDNPLNQGITGVELES